MYVENDPSCARGRELKVINKRSSIFGKGALYLEGWCHSHHLFIGPINMLAIMKGH